MQTTNDMQLERIIDLSFEQRNNTEGPGYIRNEITYRLINQENNNLKQILVMVTLHYSGCAQSREGCPEKIDGISLNSIQMT